MTIVDLKGQELDLKSKCCHADLRVVSSKVHIYYCKECKRECAVVVSEEDNWGKDKEGIIKQKGGKKEKE